MAPSLWHVYPLVPVLRVAPSRRPCPSRSVQGGFWYFRTRNLLGNVTTNERHNHHRYSHFKTVDGAFHNPFDRGPRRNCQVYFCGDGNRDAQPMLAALDARATVTSSTTSG